MARIAVLALVVLACAVAANARTYKAVDEFWTDGTLKPGKQQAGGPEAAAAATAAVTAAGATRQPATSSKPGSAASMPAAPRPSSIKAADAAAKPAPSGKAVLATPRRADRPNPATPAPGAPAREGPSSAARDATMQPRHQAATSGSSSRGASRPAAAAPVAPQQILPPFVPPTVIRPPLGGGTEPMTRFSKDIRGLQLSMINIKLNPTTLSADGQSITGFTFAGDLQCMAAAAMPIVGTCYISADMLADDNQAMATAICVTNTNAPNCDPMLTGSLTITSTGMLTVNRPPAAAATSPVIDSFNTVTPMIVDGVYSSSRPDTLLGSIVGFRRGSLDVPGVKRTDTGGYTGSVTLSLFKGPVL